MILTTLKTNSSSPISRVMLIEAEEISKRYPGAVITHAVDFASLTSGVSWCQGVKRDSGSFHHGLSLLDAAFNPQS